MPSENPELAKIGLRERKKLKTRLTLQQQAVRLFREQGYQATTIDQIAEASEISPSTFFRYFATKEALVLEDDYDPIFIREFQKLSADLNAIQAFRAAARAAFSQRTKEESRAIRERMEIMVEVPELRAAFLLQLNNTLLMLAGLMAERLGLAKDDLEVLTFAGTVLGATMAAQLYCTTHPEADFVETVDMALAKLEGAK